METPFCSAQLPGSTWRSISGLGGRAAGTMPSIVTPVSATTWKCECVSSVALCPSSWSVDIADGAEEADAETPELDAMAVLLRQSGPAASGNPVTALRAR
mmetsp:Transcript_113185/g.225381  ORF Transcript_113185/g.225381 Transcript_113185/m.225381 type:complete len:100 (-) Transcript_113185:79-378(-)